jgi:DNA mismatch endonuclease (patch repair protein)
MKDFYETAPSPERSKMMANVRSTHTKPELVVRHSLHNLGYRYRLHVKELPGRPDIVLPRYKTIFLVNGCFWHLHHCAEGHMPSTNISYWEPKLLKNRARDLKNAQKLRRLGWSVYHIWECYLDRTDEMSLQAFLSDRLNRSRRRLKLPQ